MLNRMCVFRNSNPSASHFVVGTEKRYHYAIMSRATIHGFPGSHEVQRKGILPKSQIIDMVKGEVMHRSQGVQPYKHRWMYGKAGYNAQCGHVRLGSWTHGFLLTRGSEVRPCVHCGENKDWASFKLDDTFIHAEGCRVSDCHKAPCGPCCEEHCFKCGTYLQVQCYCCGGERTDEADRARDHDPKCEGSC